MTDLHRDLLDVIEHAITHSPRSLQTKIGPSEIGTPCDRCLGHKLAGTAQLPGPVPWLAAIGTAVHAWLDSVFIDDALAKSARGEEPRWISEARVNVGEIDGEPIEGTCDLFDVETETTVDWKIVGATTLKSARSIGPSPVYRVQAHLYGRGWTRARGRAVRHVAICYLPRNAATLDHGHWWTEPYDEQIALDALARADALAKAIRISGPDRVLPKLQRLDGCLDCARYPRYPTDPPEQPALGQFADLVGTQQ